MVLTFEEAKEIALSVNHRINSANDFGNAYAFYDKDAECTEGGNHDVVIMKATGKILNVTSYLMDGYCEGELSPKRIPMGKKRTVK